MERERERAEESSTTYAVGVGAGRYSKQQQSQVCVTGYGWLVVMDVGSVRPACTCVGKETSQQEDDQRREGKKIKWKMGERVPTYIL